MAEAIFQIGTEYAALDSGLLVRAEGVAFAVVGALVTEQLRDEVAQQEVRMASHDAIVLVSPQALVSAAQRYIAEQQWRRAHPEAAAAQERPQIVLPDGVRPGQ